MTYNESRINAMYKLGPEKWAEENIRSVEQAKSLRERCQNGLQSPFTKWDSEAIYSFTIEACDRYIARHSYPA